MVFGSPILQQAPEDAESRYTPSSGAARWRPRLRVAAKDELPSILRIHLWVVSKNSEPLLGSPYNKSPVVLVSSLGPLIFGNSYIGLKGAVNIEGTYIHDMYIYIDS